MAVAEPSVANEGFTVLKGWLSPAEVAHLRDVVDDLLAAPQDESCVRPNNTLVPIRWDNPVVSVLLASGERIQRLGRATDAEDLRWISGYISVKEPQSPPLWWHQDWWCWDHPVSFRAEPSQVAVLCYLTDTDQSNGALRVLPGSQAHSMQLHHILPEAHADAATALDADHDAMRDQPTQQTVGVRAGDAVVTDYRLLHGTHANLSSERRDCVLLSFAPAWHHLLPEIRGHLISHTALPSNDENPQPSSRVTLLLPSHHGARADLPLNRNAPKEFSVKP